MLENDISMELVETSIWLFIDVVREYNGFVCVNVNLCESSSVRDTP